MTAISMTMDSKVASLGEDLLRYANTAGVHIFQPEQSQKQLTIIGNTNQGLITLVFCYSGDIWHLSLNKWFWNIPLVRWICALWLNYQ